MAASDVGLTHRVYSGRSSSDWMEVTVAFVIVCVWVDLQRYTITQHAWAAGAYNEVCPHTAVERSQL
jgi:predicted ABC-type sugar transport system permease subunit